MNRPADSNMNEPNRGQPTDCQKQIETAIAELGNTLERAANPTTGTPAECESFDADICLATRSAYFDFYTWVVLNGMIDRPAEEELDRLFRRALSMMQPNQFQESVRSRYDEFKQMCARVRAGVTEWESASSVDARD